MKYKIITVWFPSSHRMGVREWLLFRRGFKKSAVENTVDAEIKIIEPPTPDKRDNCKYSYTANNLKLKYWIDEVKSSKLPVVLMDIDTIILNDLHPAFNEEFDIAVTHRPGKSWLNGGVIFVRPTKASVDFLEEWLALDNKLYASPSSDRKPELLKKLQRETDHDGMNQPSFVSAWQNTKLNVKIKTFPCRIWNNCDQTWHQFDEDTAVVHVKGKLRLSMLLMTMGRTPDPNHHKLLDTIMPYYDQPEVVNSQAMTPVIMDEI